MTGIGGVGDGPGLAAVARAGRSAVSSGGAGHGARVDVVVDAELGILLRCEQSGGGEPRVPEFTRLEAALAVDEALYAPPPGSRVVAAGAAARDLTASAASVSVVFPWLAPEPAAAPARPAVRRLAGLAAGSERWDFAFDVPAGLRVVRAGADDDRPTAPLRIGRDVARSGSGRTGSGWGARRAARPARLGRPSR